MQPITAAEYGILIEHAATRLGYTVQIYYEDFDGDEFNIWHGSVSNIL